MNKEYNTVAPIRLEQNYFAICIKLLSFNFFKGVLQCLNGCYGNGTVLQKDSLKLQK